jgi:hypothetical protein
MVAARRPKLRGEIRQILTRCRLVIESLTDVRREVHMTGTRSSAERGAGDASPVPETNVHVMSI